MYAGPVQHTPLYVPVHDDDDEGTRVCDDGAA